MAGTCARCNHDLDQNNFCSQCSVTAGALEKIQAMSKLFYNEGLQKAKARDLSGAIEILTRSIKYDKGNIDARNLLGLVYFEIGETVLALKQWVVSQNIQPSANIANDYLAKIQENTHNLEKLNSSIKKYNQALSYIEQGSSDLAIIQLKKILTITPNFVKAYCLLALVYIKDGERLKAKKELVKALAIDKSNYIANKYFDEVSDSGEESVMISPEEEVKKERKRARRQMVINQSVQQFLGVVFGLAVGAALIYFLYMPDRIDMKDAEIEARDEQIQVAEEKIEELELLDDENEAAIKKLELDLRNAITENEQLSSKDSKVQKLMLTMTSYLEGNIYDSATYLETIDITDSTDGILNGLYEQLVEIVYVEAATLAYTEGRAAYNNRQYETGVEKLEIAVKYVVDEDLAAYSHYFLGRCYQLSDRTEEALERFKYVIDNYPDSDRIGYATDFYIYLGGTLD